MTQSQEQAPRWKRAEMPDSALTEDGLVARMLGVVAPPAPPPLPPRPPQPRFADAAYFAFAQICNGNSDDEGTYEADEELVRKALKRLSELEMGWGRCLPSGLLEIGRRLRAQDNRCTADPIFQVRGRLRDYGMDPGFFDDLVWIDIEDGAREVPPPADPENPGDSIIQTGYQDRWEFITVAFTEGACEEYLERNRHRLSGYRDLDIYADSLYRCPEMIAIRKFLMSLPEPQS